MNRNVMPILSSIIYIYFNILTYDLRILSTSISEKDTISFDKVDQEVIDLKDFIKVDKNGNVKNVHSAFVLLLK